MKTWHAAILGGVGIVAVVALAMAWIPSDEVTDPYWICMSEFGLTPDTPASEVDPIAFDRANDACD